MQRVDVVIDGLAIVAQDAGVDIDGALEAEKHLLTAAEMKRTPQPDPRHGRSAAVDARETVRRGVQIVGVNRGGEHIAGIIGVLEVPNTDIQDAVDLQLPIVLIKHHGAAGHTGRTEAAGAEQGEARQKRRAVARVAGAVTAPLTQRACAKSAGIVHGLPPSGPATWLVIFGITYRRRSVDRRATRRPAHGPGRRRVR